MDLEKFYSFLENEDTRYEHILVNRINEYWKGLEIPDDPPEELKYESISFMFEELTPKKSNTAYYGPLWISNNSLGQIVEFPSRMEITEKHINYWQLRLNSTQNILLKCRYSGLLVDFSEEVTGSKAINQVYVSYMECLYGILKERMQTDRLHVQSKANRLYNIAIQRNSAEFITLCKATLFDLEGLTGDNSLNGLLGICFDILFSSDKRKLQKDDIQLIIKNLRINFNELLNAGKSREAENVGDRLLQYHNSVHERADSKFIIDSIANLYKKDFPNYAAMQKIAILEDLLKKYKISGLEEDAKLILREIKNVSPENAKQLKKISTEMSIPTKVIEDAVNTVVTGDWPQRLFNTIQYFIPDEKELNERLLELKQVSPMQYLIRMQLIDYRGRVMATLNPYEMDPAGHQIHHLYKELQFSQVFFLPVFDRLTSIPDEFELNILEFIYKSPVFAEDRLPILTEAIKSFTNKNYLTAIHLFLPQIEEALRQLIHLGGGTILRSENTGQYDLVTLNSLLDDAILLEAFDVNIKLYFKTVLADKKGWNMRNMVAHGATGPGFFSYNAACRLIHILLILGMVRLQE